VKDNFNKINTRFSGRELIKGINERINNKKQRKQMISFFFPNNPAIGLVWDSMDIFISIFTHKKCEQ
jgi:hypothetical protein